VQTPLDRPRLRRRARLLAVATVSYNAVEAVVGLTAGNAASSVGLLGFGLDSVVEVSGGLIILWQFSHAVPESRERAAQKAMAVAFWGLALFVGIDAVSTILRQERPETSVVGMVLAAVSLCVMPLLAWAKRRTGRALGSHAVVSDSVQSLLCTYLSGILLVGLALNALLGWWWADPIAALAIALVAAREGWESWQGDDCEEAVTDEDEEAPTASS
jgi:divalent metal cation (Fe/Co/Zn/Cd) transporter